MRTPALAPVFRFLERSAVSLAFLYSRCRLATIGSALSVVWLLSVLPPAQAANSDGIVLVKGGQAAAKIYMEEDWQAAPQGNPETDIGYWKQQALHDGVTDLRDYLQRISGATIEVVTVKDASEVQRPGIVLGRLATSMGARSPKPLATGEGYRIQAGDGLVKIAGDSELGLQYGIYDFLGSLGCAWVFPGPEGEVVPSRPDLEVAPVDRSSSPGFAFRNIWWGGGARIMTKEQREVTARWSVRNRLTPERFRLEPLSLRNGHFWGFLVSTFKDQFQAHPEMLALVRQPDGSLVRKGPQVETSDPRIVDLIVQYIDGEFQKNHWPNDQTVCFSVGPADGGGFSVSPESQLIADGEIDPTTGNPRETNSVVRLANLVLDKVRTKYPNLYLGEYIYASHAAFPGKYKPDPRFVGVVADIDYSRYNSALDTRSPSRNLYRNILSKWNDLHREQGNPLYFRGYNFNLAEALLPYSKAAIWGQDIPWYQQNGYEGFSIECTPSFSLCAPSDYVLSRLAWDPSTKWEDALHDYATKAFGPDAGKYMEQYFLLQIKCQQDAVVEAGGYWGIRAMYSPDFVRQAGELFDQADKAATTPQQKTLVGYFRYPVEYLDLFLQLYAARDQFDFGKTAELFHSIQASLDKSEAENPFISSNGGRRYVERFWSAPVSGAAHYSTGDYAVVAKVPEQLSTFIDTVDSGESMEIYRPEIRTSGFLQTHTYSTTWSQQGLGNLGKSTVWYFFDFPLQAIPAGQRVGLFLGSVESRSQVWINGKPVGERSGFATPHVYDITSTVQSGQSNHVAIEVKGAGGDDLGLGGLVWPSFVFTGPTIDAAPVPSPNQRILPGGGIENTDDSAKSAAAPAKP